jgi:DNA processing protein
MDMAHYWLLLHSVPGMGPATLNNLLQVFGDPQGVLRATPEELADAGLRKSIVDSILSLKTPDTMSDILSEMERREFRIVTHDGSNYPKQLATVKYPPPILYVYGNLEIGRSLAVIGARSASPQGLEKAHEFASELASSGFTIVSGYAKGVDTHAHLGAIRAGGQTVMVLPTGVLKFSVHREFSQIRDLLFKKSTILSESFPSTGWSTGQALLRNRLTSGLSDAVVVIEAGIKGGTSSTVRWAKQQGKRVFFCSRKTPHRTQREKEILEMGATEVETPQEIVEFLNRR